jgi:hypothetical protein
MVASITNNDTLYIQTLTKLSRVMLIEIKANNCRFDSSLNPKAVSRVYETISPSTRSILIPTRLSRVLKIDENVSTHLI